MDVITLASRKGGAGKSTLTAQLAAQAHALGKRVTVIDADSQGSLSLWHARRAEGAIKLATAERGLERAIAFAMIEGSDYVFIDTAPTMWVVESSVGVGRQCCSHNGDVRRRSLSKDLGLCEAVATVQVTLWSSSHRVAQPSPLNFRSAFVRPWLSLRSGARCSPPPRDRAPPP